MHLERSKLGTMAWYRLIKVIYLIIFLVFIIGSVLISFSDFSFGIGALVFVGFTAEIVRQLFFYVVTGEFLNNAYKANLVKVLKILAVILIGILVVMLIGKVVEKAKTSSCTSKLGDLGVYEDGTCECIYGYTLENGSCISDEKLCEEKLGQYSIYKDGFCRCLINYSEVNGTCVFTSDICAKQFGDNAEGVPGEDKCVCKVGYKWNESRDKCVKIEAPKLSEKEKCEQQGYKAKFNVMSNNCECTYDFVKINGVCQDAPYCGENAHYDEQQKCLCNSGYKKEGGKCVQPDCTLNSSYNSATDTCQCNAGYLVRDGQCKSAILLCGLFGKYDPSNGNCVQCDIGYELQGRDCVFTGY